LVLSFILLLGISSPALAQSADPEQPTPCQECHLDLYFNYDRGKAYCIHESTATCVDCHSGDPNTPNKEPAHQGLVARPTLANPPTCTHCHAEDAPRYIARFEEIAGLKPHPCSPPVSSTNPPSTSPGLADETSPGGASGLLNSLRQIGTLISAAGSLGFAALAVYLYVSEKR
jgi:hypothetical protein